MRPWINALLAGLFTAVLGVLFNLTSFGAGFEENQGLSWLFRLRGPIPPPQDVVVVAIDDQTGNRLGLSKRPRDWPRTVHARLVEKLSLLGVSAIVFDLDFQFPKDPRDDAAFGRAIADSGKVILTQKLVGKRQPLIDASGKEGGSVWVEQLISPIPVLAEAANGLGPFPLPKTQVAVHQFWAFKPSMRNAPTIPALALQMHAMPAYPAFRNLLKHAALKEPITGFPEGSEVGEQMRELRSLFDENPELGEVLSTREQTFGESLQRGQIEALTGLYTGREQRYLNFYGPPGSIPTIPYHHLAGSPEEAKPPALPDLEGKVAFVGFSDLYDPGQPDRFYTVFSNEDGVDLSGVEIAATAFGNLVTNRSIKPAGMIEQNLLLSLLGVLLGAMIYRLPPIAGIPLAVLLLVAYVSGAYTAFVDYDLWLPLSIPFLVQFPFALFGGLFAQYLLERGRKTRATRAISLYLPENLARDFTEKNFDDSALNRVTYSVCFASDMAGFTSIAEKLRPKELAAFLNEYFEVLSTPLKRHGVDVIEFRADGIMCAWTADQPSPLVHRKALLAGIEAVEAIESFKQRHALLSQSLRIGVEAGSAYIGHAGGGGHFVYSIVGDCANTAARIEGLNKQVNTRFLATRAVVEGVEGLLTRFLGEFRFVGKVEALPIFEILGLKEGADESRMRLCERFAAAMDEMNTERWEDACEFFEGILRDFPDDGPSRFHLRRCRSFIETPPEDSPWIVQMDAK